MLSIDQKQHFKIGERTIDNNKITNIEKRLSYFYLKQ